MTFGKRRSDERVIKEILRFEKLELRYVAEDKFLHARVVNSYIHILQWSLGTGPDNNLETAELTLLLPEEDDKEET